MSEGRSETWKNVTSARRARGVSRRWVVAIAGILAVTMALGSFAFAANLYGQTGVTQSTNSGFDGQGVADPNLPTNPTLALATDNGPGSCVTTGTYTGGQAAPLALVVASPDQATCATGGFPSELWTITPAATVSSEGPIYFNLTMTWTTSNVPAGGYSNSVMSCVPTVQPGYNPAVYSDCTGSVSGTTVTFVAGANTAQEPITLLVDFNGAVVIGSLNLYWT
jgi:hypothetical protein